MRGDGRKRSVGEKEGGGEKERMPGEREERREGRRGGERGRVAEQREERAKGGGCRWRERERETEGWMEGEMERPPCRIVLAECE